MAVETQLDQYTHTCFQVLAYEPYVELAERLNAKRPCDYAKKTLSPIEYRESLGLIN